jgi:hypothetical protein
MAENMQQQKSHHNTLVRKPKTLIPTEKPYTKPNPKSVQSA